MIRRDSLSCPSGLDRLSLSPCGFPTTIIFDKQGRERARLSGGADWNGKESRAMVEALLRE